MSEQTPGPASEPLSLPDAPNLEWLRKQARRRLAELRKATPEAILADAQLDLARRYGFPSWRALKAHVDSLTVEGKLFAAARAGDVAALGALLDENPDKLRARSAPYGWTLLHLAASEGHLTAVDLLLRRGLDVNTREQGDNTVAMHWAAAAGRVDVVRRLADAGSDVIGHGDDHELEIIGWATCWDGCDDDAHRAVADFLISRGARHHIFSAIAMNLAPEVRRIIGTDPTSLRKPMSHNESFQQPLHFAIRKNRPEMVALLLELGADPLATDGSEATAATYAAMPNVDPQIIAMLVRRGKMDLFSALVLGDENTASRLLAGNPGSLEPGGRNAGAMHLLAKRGDVRGVRWLLDRGATPNARWSHWGAEVTPLHLAAVVGHGDVVRLLLASGADATIHDTMHDSDARGWAEHAGQVEIVRILDAHAADG